MLDAENAATCDGHVQAYGVSIAAMYSTGAALDPVLVLCRSCVQQAAEAEGRTARAEWQSLSSLLAQVILAHVPSLPEQSSRVRAALLTHQLLGVLTAR